MLIFCNLFSGSSGNATYIGTEEEGLLVDCGVSGKALFTALEKAGLKAAAIRGIFVTHDHSDHTRGVGVLSRKLGVPVISGAQTLAAMDHLLEGVPTSGRIAVEPGGGFFLGELECACFPLPHDALCPMGCRVFQGGVSAACATDLGNFSADTLSALAGCEAVLLEFNHDPELLKNNPNYPEMTKRRILGKNGHLSNAQGSEAAAKLVAAGTRHLMLGHLSRENNRPPLALDCARAGLEGLREGVDFTLSVASPDGPRRVYQLK